VADQEVIPSDIRVAFVKQHAENPELFEKPSYPTLWKICSLDDLIETPMHLAMGVIKAVSKLVHIWAGKIGKAKILTEHMKGWISIMMKHCRVNAHRLAMYSSENKFPGWVADTFRTWNKLMPWFYSCLSQTSFEHTPFQPPNLDWKKWTKPILASFLKSRLIDFPERAKIAEMRTLLENNLLSDGSLPPVRKKPVHQITTKDVQQLVWHCHNIFKLAFGTDIGREIEMESHVKLFLSLLHRVDRLTHANDKKFKKPIYLAKYNMISLLRAIPKQKLDWTSFRYTQEGGWREREL